MIKLTIIWLPLYHLLLVGGFNPSEQYEFLSWDDDIPNWMESHKIPLVPNHQHPPTSIESYLTHEIQSDQWEFQDPKMEVLYHIRPYFMGIFLYIGLKNRPLIYGRYLQSIGSWCMAIDHPIFQRLFIFQLGL